MFIVFFFHHLVVCLCFVLTAGVCGAPGADGLWGEHHDQPLQPDSNTHRSVWWTSTMCGVATASWSWCQQTGWSPDTIQQHKTVELVLKSRFEHRSCLRDRVNRYQGICRSLTSGKTLQLCKFKLKSNLSPNQNLFKAWHLMVKSKLLESASDLIFGRWCHLLLSTTAGDIIRRQRSANLCDVLFIRGCQSLCRFGFGISLNSITQEAVLLHCIWEPSALGLATLFTVTWGWSNG